MGLADLKRVTDLFVEGEEVVLRDDAEPVLLWVNKLNSFEMEEARRDGAAARSRLVLAIKEIGTAEYDQVQARLAEMSDAALKDALVDERSNEFFVEAIDAIRRDPDWRERLEATERRSPDMTDEERQVVEQLDREYSAEVQSRIDAQREAALLDLDPFGTEELGEKYREMWLEQRGMQAFSREFQKSQLYFATRVCRATAKTPTGAWDHSRCEGHRQRALDSREEVAQLPEGLITALLTSVRMVTVDRRDARFSDALASSSESSAQPSEAGASTPSTPEEMSPVLATTSS